MFKILNFFVLVNGRNVVLINIKNSVLINTETRPDTWLPQLRVGGQGPYLRSLDHFGRSCEIQEMKS